MMEEQKNLWESVVETPPEEYGAPPMRSAIIPVEDNDDPFTPPELYYESRVEEYKGLVERALRGTMPTPPHLDEVEDEGYLRAIATMAAAGADIAERYAADQIVPAIDDWLDAHPEATTTVEDGAVTTAKIADGSITDAKLATSNSSFFPKAVTGRTNLNSSSDMNSVIQAGYYFKDNGVAVTNGVNSNRAKIVCFNAPGATWGNVQVWFDCNSASVYYRIKSAPTSDWTDWVLLMTSKTNSSLKVSMPIHSIPENHGLWASSTGNLTRSRATINRYLVKGASKISISWTPKTNDKLFVLRYDATGTFLEYSSWTSAYNPCVINNIGSTEYISVCVYSTVNNIIPNPDITITAHGIDTIKEVKNPSFGSNIADTRWYKFGYYVGDYESDGSLLSNVNTGMIMLPPNYSAEGKPVPVIIMVHGSEAYMTINGTQNASYEEYYNFLNDCGFALIDCYGWTKRFDSDGTNLHNPWPIPTTEKAYKKLLELTLEGFNLDKNNVFVLCKSLGGKIAEWLASTQNVQAAAFLAPALSMNFGYADSKYRTIMVEDMGLTGVANIDLGWATPEACLADFVSNYRSWPNGKREAFYLHNEQEIMGVDPEFINLAGGTATDLLKKSAENDWSTGTFCRVNYVPTKVWYANDDTAISPTACDRFAQQIRNGGGFAETRLMPNGTGGHHSVDTDENALQKENVTTPLGETYESVPLAYYEVWEFFERFKKA